MLLLNFNFLLCILLYLKIEFWENYKLKKGVCKKLQDGDEILFTFNENTERFTERFTELFTELFTESFLLSG